MTKTKVKNGGKTRSTSKKKERHFCFGCHRDNCRHSIMKCKKSKLGYCKIHKSYFCIDYSMTTSTTSTTTTLSPEGYPYTFIVPKRSWLDRFFDWLLK